MSKKEENISDKKMVGFRADTAVIEKFDNYLARLRDEKGESVTKEMVMEFFMDYCVELPLKDFLKMYHAYKLKKYS